MTYLRAFWWGRKENSIGFIVSPDLWRYRELVRRADVVHIQGYRHFLFVGAALLAQRYGVPYVVQTHGAMPSRFGRSRLKRVFDRSVGRFVLSRASYAVALSDTEVEDYTRQGVASSRIAKIFNPLDPAVCPELPDRETSRRRLGIQPDEKVILFLARLHEKKGLELLIRAVAAREHRRDLRLLIVGPDDGYGATAERLIAQLRLQ
ncbi:MAG: glycosyltransferase, partial [Calditrichaeota bacterium]